MSPPFASVLVANRGEIACRIFRTARAMGMRCIAVYSDADAKAKHVREADVAVHIGAAPAAESYLRGDKILAAAKETGAAAIHPGYGFLSENPEFAEAVTAAGLIWIGPTPRAIRAMGLKDEAKRIAIAAGVPVLAGYQGEDQSEKLLLDEAKAIGFPVLIKAVAGGGGRGIREVGAAKDFKEQLASARREAKAAFGDDRVLIEKLVQRPRHIEVQVFGDRHGNLVHLYERDCSLQRRRQKVIEEAPAPGMTDDMRAAMTDAALKVARAVDYENAGTVEFIVDGEGPLRADGFWFLEMNTRLQVEHPVTEAITGLDLVEWQFRVAAGEKLPKKQSEIALDGHAIEARICAEDPSEGFRPSVGRIQLLRSAPTGRWDAGFEDGDVVPSDYDSLIAKAIVHSRDRELARLDARAGCMFLKVRGITTNAAFLMRCLETPEFVSGHVHTGVIAAGMDRLVDRASAREDVAHALGRYIAAATASKEAFGVLDGFRLNSASRQIIVLQCDGERFDVRVGDLAPMPGALNNYVNIGGIGGAMALILSDPDGYEVLLSGETFRFEFPGALVDHAGIDAGDEIHAPLPGKIVALSASAGAAVTKGDSLVTLEAMKMEHALKAPRDGIVAEVAVREGAQVAEGALLVRLAAEEDA